MMNSLRSDASKLRQIAKELKAIDPAIVTEARKAVRDEGKRAAADAADSAGKWSTRIPNSIKVTNRGLINIVIRAGGTAAPHAAAYENKGRAGTFRHPLNYPNQGSRQHWVSQGARPFLLPSLMARLGEIKKALAGAAITAIESKLKV